jgi:hypothetical protein
MKTKIVERRTILKGGAAAFGMLGSGASASMVTSMEQARAIRLRHHFRIKSKARFSVFVKPFRPTSITSTSKRSSDRFSLRVFMKANVRCCR